jgi:hypothetical protein
MVSDCRLQTAQFFATLTVETDNPAVTSLHRAAVVMRQLSFAEVGVHPLPLAISHWFRARPA